MELTNSQCSFIRAAIEDRIASLENDKQGFNEPLVVQTIQSRIDDMQPVLEALESGEWVFELVEF